MKKISNKQKILQLLFYLFFFIVIIIIFAMADLGLRWDNLDKNNLDTWGYVSLIIFRLIIYIIPAIIVWGFNHVILKNKIKISNCYSLQFFLYSIVLAIYNLASLDYLWKVEIFNKLDSFAFLLGLLISISVNKKIPVDATNKFDVNNK